MATAEDTDKDVVSGGWHLCHRRLQGEGKTMSKKILVIDDETQFFPAL